MALESHIDYGSSRLVPKRHWTCPEHEYPQTHVCDCEFCERGYYTCKGCEAAAWEAVTDEEGNVVMIPESPLLGALKELQEEHSSLISIVLGENTILGER